jgi:CheY-like chemotaxis protein
VLDPEPVVRSVIARILDQAGYTVEAFESVQMAVEIVKAARPDLVITNVYLPGIPDSKVSKNARAGTWRDSTLPAYATAFKRALTEY